ncbi:hypothetical protein, partial [Frankia sp. CiP3]|uniref:hypothetical protein n=1 Tax=Frankia sp. CiP3 TaxID=2880971 RepID=UPI001EF3EDFD
RVDQLERDLAGELTEVARREPAPGDTDNTRDRLDGQRSSRSRGLVLVDCLLPGLRCPFQHDTPAPAES